MGCGAKPRFDLLFARNVNPEVRTLELQPVRFLQQPTANGLGEALHFEKSIPVLRTALGTDDNRVPGNLRLVKKLLHQKLVFELVVREFVDAEQPKVAIIPDTRFESLSIFLFEP